MISLILTFMKIGCLGFGGGSAVAPLIHKEIVEKKKWITEEDFVNFVALANSLPGPSMVEMAAAIGYKTKGYLGAILSGIVIILPSVLMFIFFLSFLEKYISAETLEKLTTPVLATVAALMVSISKKFFLSSIKEIQIINVILITLISFSSIYFLNVHPSLVIVSMILLVAISRIRR